MATTSVLRRSVLAEITCTAPRVPTISRAIRPECLAPSDRPKAKPARLTSSHINEKLELQKGPLSQKEVPREDQSTQLEGALKQSDR